MLKSKLLSSISVVVLALMISPVSASEPTGGEHEHHAKRFYVSLYGGWAMPTEQHDFALVGGGATFPYRAGYDSGYIYGGAAGVILSNNFRIELDVSQSKNDFQNYSARSGAFTGQNVRGSMDLTTVMANGWFNANFGLFSPYVGGGIGWGSANGKLTVSNGVGRQFDGDDSGLALQVGGGVRIPLGQSLELDVGYRWKHLSDINFASAIPGFTTTNNDINVQSVQVGINFKF